MNVFLRPSYGNRKGRRENVGTILLLVSVLCVALGTRKLIGLLKGDKPGSKTLWFVVTGAGIMLFFLLKLLTDT
jgi:VIT1/CCC1 family predicted Fe2+/Mn2+ transporter